MPVPVLKVFSKVCNSKLGPIIYWRLAGGKGKEQQKKVNRILEFYHILHSSHLGSMGLKLTYVFCGFERKRGKN